MREPPTHLFVYHENWNVTLQCLLYRRLSSASLLNRRGASPEYIAATRLRAAILRKTFFKRLSWRLAIGRSPPQVCSPGRYYRVRSSAEESYRSHSPFRERVSDRATSGKTTSCQMHLSFPLQQTLDSSMPTDNLRLSGTPNTLRPRQGIVSKNKSVELSYALESHRRAKDD